MLRCMNQLRPARPEDITALSALIRRSGLGLSVPFYSAEQAAAMTEYVFGVDSQLVEDQTYFVIECAGLARACGGWSRRRTLFGGDQTKSGPDPWLVPGEEPARIRAFFVEPGHARQGLGRQLMAASLHAARAAGFTAMELAATLPGVPLYKAGGFQAVEHFAITLPAPAPHTGTLSVPLVRMHRHL